MYVSAHKLKLLVGGHQDVVIPGTEDGPFVSMPVVERSGVVALEMVHEPIERSEWAPHDQVVVVRHQAVFEDFNARFFPRFLHEREEQKTIAVGFEQIRIASTVVRDVMNTAVRIVARWSRHATTVEPRCDIVG